MLTAYLRLYFNLLLLRAGPQDIPYSRSLTWLTLMLAFLVSLTGGALIYSPSRNLVLNLLDMALLLLFLDLILRVTGKHSRFMQTVAAVCGAETLLQLLGLPSYWLITGDRQEAYTDPAVMLALWYSLLLLVYSILVLTHIVRHALSTNILNAVLVTLAYSIASVMLIDAVVPAKN